MKIVCSVLMIILGILNLAASSSAINCYNKSPDYQKDDINKNTNGFNIFMTSFNVVMIVGGVLFITLTIVSGGKL